MYNSKGVPIDFIRKQLSHSFLSTSYRYIYNPLTEKESCKALTKTLSSGNTPGDPEPSEPENIIAFDEKQLKIPAHSAYHRRCSDLLCLLPGKTVCCQAYHIIRIGTVFHIPEYMISADALFIRERYPLLLEG